MINYFQHIAIGVKDLDKTYRFYRDILGFRIIFFDAPTIRVPDGSLDAKGVELVLVNNVRMLFCLHPKGGAGIEFVQFTNAEPKPPPRDVMLGDKGFTEVAIRVNRLDEYIDFIISSGVEMLTEVREKEWIDGRVRRYAYLRDPDGNLVQLVETPEKNINSPLSTLGVEHFTVGVTDLGPGVEFYTQMLDWGEVLHTWEEKISGANCISDTPIRTKNKLIGTRDDRKGQAGMVNQSRLQLTEAVDHDGMEILKNRRWGDIGLLEVAMDVSKIKDLVIDLKAKNASIYTNIMDLKLGLGSYGNFTFILDPFGNLIELVNLEKIYFMPSNVLGGAVYTAVKAMDKFRRGNVDLDPLFNVRIVN